MAGMAKARLILAAISCPREVSSRMELSSFRKSGSHGQDGLDFAKLSPKQANRCGESNLTARLMLPSLQSSIYEAMTRTVEKKKKIVGPTRLHDERKWLQPHPGAFIRQSTPDPQDIPPVTTAPTAPRNSSKATAPRSWSEASRNRLHQYR